MSAETAPEPSIKFTDLGLPDPLLRALADVGYESPSPIQAATKGSRPVKRPWTTMPLVKTIIGTAQSHKPVIFSVK